MQAPTNVQSISAILACPECHGGLLQRDNAMHCGVCARDYPKTPTGWKLFTPSDSKALLSGDRSWAKWRVAMAGLQKYRESASKKPEGSSTEAALHSDGTSDAKLRLLLNTALAMKTTGELGAGSSTKVLLDIGCKDGRMGALVSDDVTYVGVDPEPVESSTARSTKQTRIIATGLAESLPIADRSVDVILCHSSFDYFVDAAKTLTEMHRVLKSGGSFLLVVSVVSTEVAHARGASARSERVLGALRAARSVGLKASSGLLADALLADRAHTHYYTRAQVMALLGVKFNLESVQEVPQSTSTILYVHAVKRQRRALKVI